MEYTILKQENLLHHLAPSTIQKLLKYLYKEVMEEFEKKEIDNTLLGAVLLDLGDISTKEEEQKSCWVEFYAIKEGDNLKLGISHFVLFGINIMPDYILERIKRWKDTPESIKWEEIMMN